MALPTPVPVSGATLAAGCTYTSEAYRNMVIQFSNLQFTIDPTDLTDAEYALLTADLAAQHASFNVNEDGELYVDDGTGPLQVDDKLFDIVAQLGWSQAPGACGVRLGNTIDTLVAVAVFDDSQSKVSFELGNPSLMELNVLNISSAGIRACTPTAPAAPAALNAATSAAATLTLAGISTAAFDLAAAQAAITALIVTAAADAVSIAAVEFPITGAVLSFATAAPAGDGALLATLRTALVRAFASFDAPLIPSSLQLSALGAAAGRRLLQSGRAAFALDVRGVRSAFAAGQAASALSGMVANGIASRGLTAKLVLAVAAVLSVTVTYATPPASPSAALKAALAPPAVAAALARAGVAVTAVQLYDPVEADVTNTPAIIGGVIGGFFGLLLLCVCVALLVRHARGRSAAADERAPRSSKIGDSALDVPEESARAPQLQAVAAVEEAPAAPAAPEAA